MNYFSTIVLLLPYISEEKRKIDGILELLEYFGVAEYLKQKRMGMKTHEVARDLHKYKTNGKEKEGLKSSV